MVGAARAAPVPFEGAAAQIAMIEFATGARMSGHNMPALDRPEDIFDQDYPHGDGRTGRLRGLKASLDAGLSRQVVTPATRFQLIWR
jgi:hypothetical protein